VAGFSATLDKVIAGVARPHRALQLCARAAPVQAAAAHRRRRPAGARDEAPILALAIEKLGEAGYLYIGMDHFAKPGDELAVAQAKKKLHRNFQGYSTKPDCDMLAFGISAIAGRRAYVANVKTLDEYYAKLDAGTLPVMRGVELDADDLIRRDVIQKLMCNFELDFAALGAQYGIAFADISRRICRRSPASGRRAGRAH